uniref:Uncharacterized protein n=1 Tax=Crocodylus porosus TaxID=8502 RepID=A0A7M4FX34_CROPO
MASPCKASDFFFVFISLLFLLPGVEALDLGDAVALLLGLAVSITGLCVCLGWYARRRNGHLSDSELFKKSKIKNARFFFSNFPQLCIKFFSLVEQPSKKFLSLLSGYGILGIVFFACGHMYITEGYFYG